MSEWENESYDEFQLIKKNWFLGFYFFKSVFDANFEKCVQIVKKA